MNVGLNVPDHITLYRRSSTLKTSLKRIGKPRGRFDLVIVSTGHVIHGVGKHDKKTSWMAKITLRIEQWVHRCRFP